MSGLKINNLYIKSFRGIRALDLSLNKKSLVLCGENGTGKSSIISAIEFLFTKEMRNLKGQGLNPRNKSVHHILDDKSDLLIEAQFTNKQYLKRAFDSIEKSDDLCDYIEESFTYGSFFLNRRKLLDFVEANEGNRYNELANFFGLQKLDEIEEVFRKTKSNLNTELKLEKEELEDISKKFSRLYGMEFEDSADILNQVNSILKENSFDEVDLNTDFEDYKTNFKDLLVNSKMKDLINKINYKFESIVLPEEEYSDLINKYNKYSLDALKSSNNLLTILKESKEYLVDKDTCPICKNPIGNEVLLSLDNDIEELTSDFNQFDNWKSDLKTFDDKLNVMKNNFESINSNIRELNELSSSNKKDEINLDSEFSKLKEDINHLMGQLNQLSKFNISILDIDTDYLKNIKSDIDSMENKFNQFANGLKIKKADENLELISSSINLLALYQESFNEINKLKNQFKMAEISYERFTALKKDFVKTLVSEIEKDVIEFYKFIHYDDEIKNPKLVVSKAKGVKLQIDFYDRTGINPRSFSSEGHLDTLGICIFLAIAKRLSKTPIMVLDDVIATVDMGHKDRIAMLLFEEFKDYQIIITTHNKLWYDQLKKMENEYRSSLSERYEFAEIIDWSLVEGPIFTRFKSEKQIIYHHLDSEYVDLHAAANGARRYLEYVLYTFCKVQGVKLRLQNEYMLKDYLPVVEEQIMELTEGTILKEYYERLFNDINATKFSSNKLSHFDEKNKLFSYDEVNRFVESVFRLEYSLFYLKGSKKLKFKGQSVIIDPNKKKKISMEEFLANIDEKCTNESKQRKRRNDF